MTRYHVGDKILRRIRSSKGSVWSPKDLLDLGSRAAVDQALKRLSSAGSIRKVARGLYDYPRSSALVGKRAPLLQTVAQAAARAKGARVRPTGAVAANALGLSTQVPARAEYVTDGPARKIDVNGRSITLKRVSPKRLAPAPHAASIIEALRYLGKDKARRLERAEIERLSRTLDATDAQQLQKAMRNAPDWMRPILQAILAAHSPDNCQ